jgi:tetratricopeptide (TPR) repeat protein
MPKLFISYKHEKENLELIKTIVSKLKSVNYDVWFDNEQLTTGDSMRLEIERGILAADGVICFLTKKYIESPNCRLEFYYSDDKDKKCIYVLLETIDRETPNGMNMFVFSDSIRFDAFKRKTENLDDYADIIFSEIIKSLGENEVASPTSIIQSFIQLNRDEGFYSREDLMEKIETIIKEKKRLCLYGYPGVGKTSCALEFFYQQMEKNNIQQIIWIDAEDQTKILKCLTDFGKIIDKYETNIKRLIINFLNYINKENVLVIFDNLESIDDLKQIFILETIKAPFLITTRLQRIGNFEMIEIRPFKEIEAKQFLKRMLPNLDTGSIDLIIKEYNYETEGLLPCNLRMIAGVLDKEKEKTVEEVLIECKNKGYTVNIINKLKQYSNDCIKLIKITTLIDPDYISSKLLSKLKWKKTYKDAIQKLAEYNLLTPVYPNTQYYGIKMHRIFIRDFKAFFQSQDNMKIDNETVNELMQALNKSIDYITKDPSTHLKKYNNSILHAIEILKIDKTNQSLIAADLFERISLYYSEEIQKFETAMNYQNRGLKIKLDLIKSNDPSLASTLFRTGNLYYKLGNDNKALEYYKKSFEMRERLYSGVHPDIAESLHGLALSYECLGDDNTALNYFKKSFEMRERLYSGDHPDIAESLYSLGVSYSRLGDVDKALEYKKKSLEMRERLYTSDHPDIAESLYSLGVSYSRLGDVDKALEYKKNSLEMRERLYTGDHPDIAQSLNSLAVSYGRLKDHINALEYKIKSFEMRERLYAGDHPDIAHSLNSLGVSYFRLGDVSKALEYNKKSFEMRKRLYSGDHPGIAESLNILPDNM